MIPTTIVQTIADRIIEILPGGIIDRQMTYDEYIEDESIDAIREKLSQTGYAKKISSVSLLPLRFA